METLLFISDTSPSSLLLAIRANLSQFDQNFMLPDISVSVRELYGNQMCYTSREITYMTVERIFIEWPARGSAVDLIYYFPKDG